MTAGIKYLDSFRGYRDGAWHALGTVSQEKETATDAYYKAGPWPVQKVPLFYRYHDSHSMDEYPNTPTPVYGIIGMPNHRSTRPEYITTVSERYKFFSYEDALRVLDGPDGIHRHVNAIGLLDDWMMFVTYDLPKIVVKGDVSSGYLIIGVTVDGKTAFRAFKAWERVVCRNTFNIALGQAVDMLRISHKEDITQPFQLWVQGMYERHILGQVAVEEALTVLAEHRIQKGEGVAVLRRVYPEPVPIDEQILKNLPKEDAEKRVEAWELARTKVLDLQDEGRKLYMGAGRGILDSVATKGTAYGLFQAITELENYRAGRGGEKAVATSVVFGDRASTIETAFNECLSLCKN